MPVVTTSYDWTHRLEAWCRREWAIAQATVVRIVRPASPLTSIGHYQRFDTPFVQQPDS